MNWLFLTLLSVLFSALSGILIKVLMKGDKSNPYSYTIVFVVLIVALCIPVSLIHGFHMPPATINPLLFIVSAVLWSIATMSIFKALKLIEASEATILSSGRVIITIVASIMFLGESFNVQKILGTLLILISVFIVTNLKKGMRFNRGVIYVFITVLCSGVAIVIDSYILRVYDAISFNTFLNVLMVPVLISMYPKVLKEWKPFFKLSFLYRMIPLVVVSFLQSLLYLVSLQTPGVTAQTSAIRQSSVIVTVILAILFLGERDHLLRKLAATALVTGGVILLS